MPAHLFAGIAVDDFPVAVAWYAQLFGCPPTFVAHDTEVVWDLGEHQSIFVELEPEHAGHARHLLFVDDLEATVTQIAERGLRPFERETYDNGVRKAAYRDPDGNEIGYGGAPL